MKIFFGAAIQGHKDLGERGDIYRHILATLKAKGVTICTEHTGGRTRDEIISLQEKAIGPTPLTGIDRLVFVRNKMIEFVEGDIDGAVFEVSTPSLGTGIEFAHAYLRPRIGLSPIPVLALYKKGYWENSLSTMIRGLSRIEYPSISLIEYEDIYRLKAILEDFIKNLKNGGRS